MCQVDNYATYYTAVQGTDPDLTSVEETIWNMGFDPAVFKKPGAAPTGGGDVHGSARKDVVFGAAQVYTVAVPEPKWKSRFGRQTREISGPGRRQPRSDIFSGKKLWIDYRGQVLAAKVDNSSEHGLGVEMSAPLEVEAFVSFAGIGLQGRAQVKHCRRRDDGVFHVGLSLEAVSFRKLDVSSRALPSETVQVNSKDPRLTLKQK